MFAEKLGQILIPILGQDEDQLTDDCSEPGIEFMAWTLPGWKVSASLGVHGYKFKWDSGRTDPDGIPIRGEASGGNPEELAELVKILKTTVFR